MSPDQFKDFTNKLEEKGLSFSKEGANNIGIASPETQTHEMDETMSPEQLRTFSDKIEGTGVKAADLKVENVKPTTAAQVGGLTQEDALKLVLSQLMAQN